MWVQSLFSSYKDKWHEKGGASASASVLPMNTQDWSPLGWTSWISLQSKGLSGVFSNTTVQNINSLVLSLLYGATLTSIHTALGTDPTQSWCFAGGLPAPSFRAQPTPVLTPWAQAPGLEPYTAALWRVGFCPVTGKLGPSSFPRLLLSGQVWVMSPARGGPPFKAWVQCLFPPATLPCHLPSPTTSSPRSRRGPLSSKAERPINKQPLYVSHFQLRSFIFPCCSPFPSVASSSRAWQANAWPGPRGGSGRKAQLVLTREQLGPAWPDAEDHGDPNLALRGLLAEQPQQMLDLNSSKVRGILSHFPGVPWEWIIYYL